MADSTASNNPLDDFFKKKDKSKKSKGKKPILPVAPPENNDDADKFPDDEPQNTVTNKEPVINIKLGDEDDGEWKEFEVEKDYSGLRIQAMTIKDKEEEKERERQQEIQEQENKKTEGQSGPWKVAGTANASDASTEENKLEGSVTSNEESKPVESTPASASQQQTTPSEPSKPAAYVPPSLRNRMAAGSGGGGGSTAFGGSISQLQPTKLSALVRKAKAPEIESQQEFPSLGADASAASINNSNSWRAAKR